MVNEGHINPILTLVEVSEYLRISEKTVLRMLADGEIPGFKISNQWRFYSEDIEAWLQVKRKASGPGAATAVQDPVELGSYMLEENVPVPLSRLTGQDWIMPGLPPQRREDLLVSLAAKLVENRIVDDVAGFVDGLLAREKLAPTSVGEGLAIPHLRRAEDFPVARPLVLIGTCPWGIDWDTPDHQKVRLILLPIAGSELVHLKILSIISRFLKSDETLIDRIVAADSPQAVFSVILDAERDFR